MENISKRFIDREEILLSPYAFLTSNTKGRVHPYTPCNIRTEFQRDRDKIIHSKSFRRLMHKTQVFLSPSDEHYRTRMTHTLEVTQIARIIARALRLNEDLTEAAALGHDLGHTPFGHAGEVAMQRCFDESFAHYEQSLRVVDYLEKDGKGLNLTYEVRDGIVNHTGSHTASTLEGVVVKFADRIAYINHDIDDACRAGILSLEDIPKEILDTLGRGHSQRINTMVSSIILASTDTDKISMTSDTSEATNELRAYLFKNVYTHPVAKAEDAKSQDLLASLFEYFKENPEKMPKLYFDNIERDGIGRCVCDYISGMTDRYAIQVYQNIFVPKTWQGGNT
ncbi:MAG: deoxyguanosinetriphosphate triphosphohydrolase [Clostridia bacterium]|nr:deoxyguanosinetriphosphate triphosphohydrolase [Clostridia bacterium]